MVLYELAVLGSPTDTQVEELAQCVVQAVENFGLRLGEEVGWAVRPASFEPSWQRAAAAVFYGGANVLDWPVQALLRKGTPIIPVASELGRVHEEIPKDLRALNCLSYRDSGTPRIATALLECAGLLPRQRRVFVSYRRNEASAAALQLFEELSLRQFDVFLDTHDVAAGEDFQAVLKHRLRDADVLLMLDTKTYFDSRWTAAEFGWALSTGVLLLRLGWPGVIPSGRVSTAPISHIELQPGDIDSAGRLSVGMMQKIRLELEALRSKSHAKRSQALIDTLRLGVETIGGQFKGVGPHRSALIALPDGREITVHPSVGVPTAETLQQAAQNTPDRSLAVMYHPIGVHQFWQAHLDWLGSHINNPRWLKADYPAWHLADWEA